MTVSTQCYAAMHIVHNTITFAVHATEAVNLEQRPGSHPVAHYLMPTLLRASSMWLLQKGVSVAGEDCLVVNRLINHQYSRQQQQQQQLINSLRFLFCSIPSDCAMLRLLQDLLLIMGIPSQGRQHVHQTSQTLLKKLGSSMSERDLKSMSGNGMHVAVIGSLVLCVMKNVHHRDHDR